MIVPWAAQYIGLSFADYDCWNLVRKVYREQCNIFLPSYKFDYNGPADLANIQLLVGGVGKALWEEVSSPEIGDLLLFRIRRTPCHIGICIDSKRGEMLHTMKMINAVKENYLSPFWKNRVEGCFKYIG